MQHRNFHVGGNIREASPQLIISFSTLRGELEVGQWSDLDDEHRRGVHINVEENEEIDVFMQCDRGKLRNDLEHGVGREQGIEEAVPRPVKKCIRRDSRCSGCEKGAHDDFRPGLGILRNG